MMLIRFRTYLLLLCSFLAVLLSGMLVLLKLGLFDSNFHLNIGINHKKVSDHDDFLSVDPYVLSQDYETQYMHRSEVDAHCGTVTGTRLGNVITISSLLHNGLWWMGGTGHWFHFSERVLPSLSEAYDNVWGDEALARKVLANDEIYIVFEEKGSVLNLGAFGRFFLVSILTGGRYQRVHLASANHALFNDNNITLLMKLNVHFTIDFAEQPVEDLFIKDSSHFRNHLQAGPAHLCATRLLHVPMISYRKRFQWFTHEKNITQFRDSYSKICNITYNKPILAPKRSSNQTRIVDEYSIVHAHGGLRGDGSQYNLFGKINDSEVLRVVVENVQHVLIYQRDSSRRIVNLDEMLPVFHDTFMSRKEDVRWSIQEWMHDNDGSPCKLVKAIATATALVTPHGFQSFLIIFSPDASLLAEIFPNRYYIPVYYGELQLSYRLRFGFPRSYLSTESVVASSLLKLSSYTLDTCVHSVICRHIARAQDVYISETFIRRIGEFLKSAFVVQPYK